MIPPCPPSPERGLPSPLRERKVGFYDIDLLNYHLFREGGGIIPLHSTLFATEDHDVSQVSGEDVDDEEFTITIEYNIFSQPDVKTNLPLNKVQERALVCTRFQLRVVC